MKSPKNTFKMLFLTCLVVKSSMAASFWPDVPLLTKTNMWEAARNFVSGQYEAAKEYAFANPAEATAIGGAATLGVLGLGYAATRVLRRKPITVHAALIVPFTDAEMQRIYARFASRSSIEAFAKNEGLVARLRMTADSDPLNAIYAGLVGEVEDIQNNRITNREMASQVDNITKDPSYVRHLLESATFVQRFENTLKVRSAQEANLIGVAMLEGMNTYKEYLIKRCTFDVYAAKLVTLHRLCIKYNLES